MRDDVPLPRAGVLRLVDQDMVDATIELVVHPARGDAVEHRQRLVDQVVVIEQPALLLLAPVVRGGGGGDMQEGGGPVAHGHGAALLDQSVKTLRLVLEQAGHGRIVIAKLLGQHRLARQLFVGEEDAEIGIDLRAA